MALPRDGRKPPSRHSSSGAGPSHERWSHLWAAASPKVSETGDRLAADRNAARRRPGSSRRDTCSTTAVRRSSAQLPSAGLSRSSDFVSTSTTSTVAVIAPDPSASRRLYVDALGLPLEGQGDDYQHSERIVGCKSSASGRCPRRLRHASERRSGRRSGRCRRSASNSTSRTPRRWVRGDTGARASWLRSRRTHRARSRGVKRWPGCNHRRVRSSGSRTPPSYTN